MRTFAILAFVLLLSPAALAQGKGMGFTGVDDPYEPPARPELTIDTGKTSTREAVATLLNFLHERGILA